ncbi:AfsR/SARP family transcriptional regulator [Actinomadura sp. 6K520]|uniref:AfsR/SARP family transcriptional regulator n=1 Tax=Actinomadura sp. 6K520 TaxID=2530364 RepID=UPI001048ECC2|nr:AfsR/SARP family transcriptional regulator [Actinomadura sp. 6K520]TDE32611.1 transcriptional regulator, SARP family protein [Actinomadura sp. 6K520]
MVRFKLLGSLEISNSGRTCAITPPKVRQVLALLLVRTGKLVQVDSVIEELWAEASPRRAANTVQTYVYQLRKIIDQEGLAPAGRELLFTQPFGYQLQIEPEQLDICVFEAEVAEGRRMLDAGQPERASQRLRQALDLWTGPPLADVVQGNLLSTHALHLRELRMRALELRIQTDVHLGRDRDLIGELRSLVARYPLHEWFHGQLIGALARAGRRAEALAAYAELRALLDRELGLDPSPELQRIHQEMLAPAPGASSGLWTEDFALPDFGRSPALANGSRRGR